MAYSLRLPDAIDASARAKADYLGISLNALICVALDAYLRAPNAPAPNNPIPENEAPRALTRAEKKRLHEQRKRNFRS